MTRQNILITGGAGFIGMRLIRALRNTRPDGIIWVFDNLHPQVHGPNAVPPDFPPGVNFVRGDVADGTALRKAVEDAQPSLVYHLAAETGTGQSHAELTRYCTVNVVGTANLIEALRSVDSMQRIVLAGSRAVYGEGGYRDSNGREYVGLPRQPGAMQDGNFNVPLPSDADLPGKPVSSHAGLAPAPASVYASTKLMQEYLLTQAGQGGHWQATIFRFQNVYGPGQSLLNPYTGVLTIFARQLLSGGTLNIFEDGKIARDFVYIDDVVDALILGGTKPVEHGTIIDIGSGQASTILDVARLLMRALGRDDDAYQITGQFRIGDVRYACADIRAAGELLDWTPQVSLTAGVRRFAEWANNIYESGNL